jgi:RimJ/RimL family protein N-acetyltransferase
MKKPKAKPALKSTRKPAAKPRKPKVQRTPKPKAATPAPKPKRTRKPKAPAVVAPVVFAPAEPVAPRPVRLVSVYDHPGAVKILHDLLRERHGDRAVNISHRDMPTWREHVAFVEGKPYAAWFIVLADKDEVAGSVYLSKQDEIGVFIFKAFQDRGLGPEALKELMEQMPRRRYLANLNPANDRSKAMFERLGFRHVQETYELA